MNGLYTHRDHHDVTSLSRVNGWSPHRVSLWFRCVSCLFCVFFVCFWLLLLLFFLFGVTFVVESKASNSNTRDDVTSRHVTGSELWKCWWPRLPKKTCCNKAKAVVCTVHCAVISSSRLIFFPRLLATNAVVKSQTFNASLRFVFSVCVFFLRHFLQRFHVNS